MRDSSSNIEFAFLILRKAAEFNTIVFLYNVNFELHVESDREVSCSHPRKMKASPKLGLNVIQNILGEKMLSNRFCAASLPCVPYSVDLPILHRFANLGLSS